MRTFKTEHAGGKNGRGFWGRRVVAKAVSRRRRRELGKAVVRAALSQAEGETI